MAARKRLPEKPLLDIEALRTRLKLRSLSSEKELAKKHPAAKNFFDQVGIRPGQIREHATRLLTSGALAGSLLLSANSIVPIDLREKKQPSPLAVEITTPENDLPVDALEITPQQKMTAELKNILPPVGTWELNEGQQTELSQKVKEIYGVSAVAELDGNKLNNQYGRMGAEQHLPRYPGDTIGQHDELQEKGITPGLGGWGYFAYSKEEMTPELYATEKWYVAVQTLYLPDWNTRTRELAAWYKHRRVVVINPENGKAVVGAVADAGPANWTGKHFGGSPEMMAYLGINYGKQNHPVVLYFLDDPEKKIPLGPLEYNVEELAKKNKDLAKKNSNTETI